jgi:hypothetical protein
MARDMLRHARPHIASLCPVGAGGVVDRAEPFILVVVCRQIRTSAVRLRGQAIDAATAALPALATITLADPCHDIIVSLRWVSRGRSERPVLHREHIAAGALVDVPTRNGR